jgi:hypothetical protein
MNWTNIINFLGGSALALAAIGWVCKSSVSHFLGRDLVQFKGEIDAANDRELASIKEKQEKELLALRGEQEKALAKLQTSVSERIETVKAALLRMERLESDLPKSRGDAYGEIWKLTGSINLFGPVIPASCAELSARLRGLVFRSWLGTDPRSQGKVLPRSGSAQLPPNAFHSHQTPFGRATVRRQPAHDRSPKQAPHKGSAARTTRRGRRLLNRRNGRLRQRMEIQPKGYRTRRDKAGTGLDRASICDECVPLPPCSGTRLEE